MLPAPTPSQLFEQLIDDCQEVIVGFYRKADRLVLESRWRLGNVLSSYEGRLPYGEGVMETLASRLRIHLSELYFSRSLRDKFGSLQALNDVIDLREKKGLSTSWFSVKKELLTTSHRLPSPTHLLDRLEHSLHILEQVANAYDDMTDEEQEEAISLMSKAKESILEVGHKLSYPKETPERSEKYLNFVRSLPCSVCSSTDNVQPHHTVRDISLKGSDLLTIPLCLFHHNKYHEVEGKWDESYPPIDKLLINTLIEWVKRTL